MMKNMGNLKRIFYAASLALSTILLPKCEIEFIDNTPPSIHMRFPVEDKIYPTNLVPLSYSILDKNFKEAWYSLDNEITKIPLEKSGRQDLDLSNGNYKLLIYAEDSFNNFSKDSVNFSVNKMSEAKDTIPPKINKYSPLEDKVYHTNIIQLQYSISDKNFKEAWYSLDNEITKIPLEWAGKKDLDLSNGDYKLLIHAEDSFNNFSKDSVNFSVDAPPLFRVINPFISTNENGKDYESLETKLQRDSLLQAKINEDWVDEIPQSTNPNWGEFQSALQFLINFHGLPYLTGYSGDNLDSIYFYQGTFKDNGSQGLPVYSAHVTSGDSRNYMNTIVTGDNTTKWEDWNFIYAPLDQMKVQPGQPYMPNNCEILIRALPQDNYSKAVSILKFKIEDGVPSLLWENDDPNVTIIKQREK